MPWPKHSSGPDAGISYNASSNAVQELLDKLKKRPAQKAVGISPLGLAARKNQNQLMMYRKLSPHIEDVAHGLSKFRFISAALDDLIQFEDPRPRNPLGEFTGQEEGGPDPNAMVKTYRIAPNQPGMAPNKGGGGPGIFGASGLAVIGGAGGALGSAGAKGALSKIGDALKKARKK